MLLEIHLLWVFALSVQGHSGADHKNGEFAVVKCAHMYFSFLILSFK